MTTDTRLHVSVSRRFDAPPERVFEAWLDPATAGRWMFSTESGQMVRAEADPQVGGRFVFVDRRDGKDVEHVGEYLAIDRPRRLIFRFSADGSPLTRVTVGVAAREDGGSELTLRHELDPAWADYAERTEAGWKKMLDRLAAVLGEGRR